MSNILSGIAWAILYLTLSLAFATCLGSRLRAADERGSMDLTRNVDHSVFPDWDPVMNGRR